MTDNALVERMARAMCLELGRCGDTEAVEHTRVEVEWPRYIFHARSLLPIIEAERVAVWQPMESAPRNGSEILLLLGTTIPDHADARAASFLAGDEADELGYREYAKYGAWMIWHDAGDWFCVDECAPLGWLPLPVKMPMHHPVIDGSPRAIAALDTAAIVKDNGDA